MKAYVADDDEGVLQGATMLLRAYGYEVTAFENGEDLLAHLKKSPDVDLVVTDMTMPGISGLDVLQEIRHDPSLHSLRVVVFTATEGVKEAIEKAGGIFAAKTDRPGLTEILESLK